MANYKEILSGTIRSLGDRVREVGENGGVKELYTRGAERAKAYARLAKLTLDLNGESEELRKVYAEIGRLFLEQNETAPSPLYQGLFARAEEQRGKLRALEEEIRALKECAESPQPEAGEGLDAQLDDFDAVVSATESDGRGE